MEWIRDEYKVSTDPELLDVDVIQGYLSRSYWAAERKREVIERSIENSLNFGVYHEGHQIGFARVVTDHATVYWLADVFILEEYRGRGLGKFLIESVTGHPELNGLLGLLATRDAHGLYRQYGFSCPSDPQRMMWTRT